MPITGNVALTDTFDNWRTKTNETIVAYNQLELANIRFVANDSSVLKINGAGSFDVSLSNTVYFDIQALSSTGGNVSGTVNINSLVANANGLFIGNMQILNNGHMILM